MLREIRQLQRKNEDLEEQQSVMSQRHERVEKIILSFKDDSKRVELVNRLKRGESHQDIVK